MRQFLNRGQIKKLVIFSLFTVFFLSISCLAVAETRTYAQDIYPKLDLLVQKNKPLQIFFNTDIVWFAAQNKDDFKFELKEKKPSKAESFFVNTINYLEVTPINDNGSTILFIIKRGGAPCILSIKTTMDKVNYIYANLGASIEIRTDKWKEKRENEKKEDYPTPPVTIKSETFCASQSITDTAPVVLQMNKITKIIFEEPINFFAIPISDRLKANISSTDPKTLEISPLQNNIKASFFVSAGKNSFYLRTEETQEYEYFDSYIIKAGYPYDSVD